MNTDKKTRRKFLKESAALALTTMAFPAWKNEAISFSVFLILPLLSGPG
jgi:hypothetical protein